MQITKDLLKSWDACRDGYGWFVTKFPQGAPCAEVAAALRTDKRYEDERWLHRNVFTALFNQPEGIADFVQKDVAGQVGEELAYQRGFTGASRPCKADLRFTFFAQLLDLEQSGFLFMRQFHVLGLSSLHKYAAGLKRRKKPAAKIGSNAPYLEKSEDSFQNRAQILDVVVRDDLQAQLGQQGAHLGHVVVDKATQLHVRQIQIRSEALLRSVCADLGDNTLRGNTLQIFFKHDQSAATKVGLAGAPRIMANRAARSGRRISQV